MSGSLVLYSLIVFLPALGALLIAFFPKGDDGGHGHDRHGHDSHGHAAANSGDDAIKLFSLAVTVVVFLLTVYLILPGEGTRFQVGTAEMQHAESRPWIPAFGIEYFFGVDGISLPLVLLTSFLSVLAMGASWPITRHVKGYCILFLLLETGMLGVFLALDFFLFFVFWEVMLLPMYFLIGVWGGPRREYAAVKFFLYTMLGGVCMVVALLMLYFHSDLKQLSPEQLAAAHVSADALQQPGEARTFNILALQQMGQHTDLFDATLWCGKSVQWWAFLLLFIGFAIKVPALPFHTWLPDAHVEAPTPISMILAGVLLKMGGYGIIRICYPICPEAAYDLAYLVCLIGVVSMVYGAFAALAQKDFKRLVAYSSVSHMGYVVLGLGLAGATAAVGYDGDYWKQGMNGAMFQMIAHGISSAGMFFLVGVLYDRVHHRNLNEFGGLFAKMPVYCSLAWVIFLAAVGLPGLCGFIGEALVTLAVWSYDRTLAVIAAATVILTAGYILWAFQRVYLGAEYKGPHAEALVPDTWRERAIALPLVAAAFLFGIVPNQALLQYMSPSVNKTVDNLVDWKQRRDAELAQTPTAAAAPTAIGQLQPTPTPTNNIAAASSHR